jgi:hypothetical protein
MIKTVIFYLVTLVLFVLARLTGFGEGQVLSGPDRAAVLAFSEATTDNLFAGLIANDYATFSRDFDTDMHEKLPAPDFAAWRLDLDTNLGNYLSRQVDQVTQADEFYVIDYQAKFEQEVQVTVTVVFHASDHSIALLTFDSEQYSWSSAGD